MSNRLPVSITANEGRPHVEPTVGGLATGLAGPHRASGGLWIGWPGDLSRWDERELGLVHAELERLRILPVPLTKQDVTRYYEGYANGVLWPLLHYLIDKIPLHAKNWVTYRKVNERFADAVVRAWRPGDVVWVQDYHLMLVPQLVRERLPDARIGFFLHIPFPSSEVFRALPQRTELVRGLLGADVVGFHTASYARHFRESVERLVGLEASADGFVVGGRPVRVGAYPMGVDAEAFEAHATDPATIAEVERVRAGRPGTTLLAVDRLDYTKGIRRRLLAFERLLERNPELRGVVQLVQVAVPSRELVESYAEHRADVDRLVGRINGAWSTVDHTPIHYLYRSFPQRDLTALYRAADVCVVTPVRDGMNLVAKEFVASRVDDDGVLVLSEFAGAADELGQDAVMVNPYDVDATADAMKTALLMPADERRERMRRMRRQVRAKDVHAWTASFLDALEENALVAK